MSASMNTCYTGNEEEEDLAKARANWAAPDDESKAVKYRVEFLYSYGWDDAHWTSGDGPWLFDSHADAWAEIDDFCSVPEFDKPYIKRDFRVIKVTPDSVCEWCRGDLSELMSPNINELCVDCTGEAEIGDVITQ